MIDVLVQVAQLLGSDMRMIETLGDDHYISGSRTSHCKVWKISPEDGLECVLDESMIADECHYSTVWDVETDGEMVYAGLYSFPRIWRENCAYVYALGTNEVYHYPQGRHVHKLAHTPQHTILASVGDGPDRSALWDIHTNEADAGVSKNPTVIDYVGPSLLVGEDDARASDGSEVYFDTPHGKRHVLDLPLQTNAWSHIILDNTLYLSTMSEVDGVHGEVYVVDLSTTKTIRRYRHPDARAWMGIGRLHAEDGVVMYRDVGLQQLHSLDVLDYEILE